MAGSASPGILFERIQIWNSEFLWHAEPNRLVTVKRGRPAGIDGRQSISGTRLIIAEVGAQKEGGATAR